ncbi:MAG: hypothetical protein EKK39_09995 [Sphingobacteriales bacterium]|uniref:hypothetical protein n=1 Tax=Hydrotalea flava TaxID=714549 RepID=UPI000836115E|nr:hypothetical protein [Hydrotalea flava]RTL49970.1 MAG: hypothetical protein EKK39_09995 [Sphingobacteriales bacterium]
MKKLIMGIVIAMATMMVIPAATNAQTVAKKTTKAKKENAVKINAKKTKVAAATEEKKQSAPKAVTTKPAAPVTKSAKSYTKPAPSTAAAGNDKVIGKDDKGRTIYEGKRGGHYYINSNGNKTYIKKN